MLSEFPRLCRKYLGIVDSKIIRRLDVLEPARQIELVRDTLCSKMNQNSKVNQNNKKNQSNRVNPKSLLELFADAKVGYEDAQDFASMCLIYFSMKLQQLSVRMRLEPGNKIDLEKAALLIKPEFPTISGSTCFVVLPQSA